ncbi:23S rRNA (cytidine(2498)-2'-O)-methyltransferase RlmM [Aliiglaciecola sp. 3_MG-2023]|uniref:23S rRNA (cytidine(2498)-2'-O)-methyltransferase RlmM n=1 Tax=Aliiglaciecola sp. 3_MG-2023 TaxID=3062644 RepID=UPI0026E439A7|nr:23S rRNA (cytidine(2498)-2'-O)-methyltransferase RlmM [Aliiglaciecola sp. 3_MG-2023]MDO6695554.1 23S rRNA (cytidine(2498)-2'-O)-methyltransferase RlmM [Aliiglaciecola sp. 3_MG-2023]
MRINSLLFYCRAGFEADLCSELQEKLSELGVYGYPRFTKKSGFVQFICHQDGDAEKVIQQLAVRELVFARQMFASTDPISLTDTSDRISPILEHLHDKTLFGELRVEYADTTDGRELSKLCRKLAVPLRQSLRKHNLLTAKEQNNKPCLFVFFVTGTEVILGLSNPKKHSPFPLGILRLRFPSSAPSRSTLKLDEGIQLFIPKAEMSQRFEPGMHAVDLGACPGGWTYQLVQRGLFVQAVDNGAMDENLMETGQVSYFPEDGFKFEPRKKNVQWLVCDMIEQPQRVAKLMANWLVKGWCKEAIFNLKLPMKQRHESVTQAKKIVDEIMTKHAVKYEWQAKHLYHDREEVTVHIKTNL